VPYFRRLVAGFPPRLLGFEPESAHVGFVVDKATLGQVFSEYFGFLFQFSFHQFHHNHHLLTLVQKSSRGRYPRGLSLTKKNNGCGIVSISLPGDLVGLCVCVCLLPVSLLNTLPTDPTNVVPSLSFTQNLIAELARDVTSPFLWRCSNTWIYTTQNRTTRIQATKCKLALKVKEGCGYHLGAVSAPQYCQFWHYRINLSTLLTHFA
jgi:hypothetical protein